MTVANFIHSLPDTKGIPYIPSIDKESPLEILIKQQEIDITNIKEGEGKDEYRPTDWNEYIGQHEAKEKIQTLIDGSINHNEPMSHLFISGHSGAGKTLLSTITANKLNKKIVFTTGGELKSEQLFIDKLVECDGGIIYIDEANRLNKRVGFFILPLMEQFSIHGKNIKPFTLIFSTTHKGDISKDLDALLQRCEQIELQDYKEDEIVLITKQYIKKQYNIDNIDNKILFNIAKNCRNIPRNAKNLAKGYIYNNDWDKVKRFNNIIFEGLTINDVKVLKYLNNSDKGASKNNIANFLRIKPQTFEWDIEPYLVHKELIEIGSKRLITKKGKDLLNFLKGEI